jgi:MYXO-CTERM domain-containing protein
VHYPALPGDDDDDDDDGGGPPVPGDDDDGKGCACSTSAVAGSAHWITSPIAVVAMTILGLALRRIRRRHRDPVRR